MNNLEKIEKENKKIHFWSLEDYCKRFDKPLNNEGLFLYIQYSIIEKPNPYISGFVKTSTKIDLGYDEYDISTDCYVYLSTKKDIESITIKDIKSYLCNFYKYVNRQKRKCNREYETDIDTISYSDNLDLQLELKELTSSLSQEELQILNLYYFKGYTYEDIGSLLGKTKQGIKFKIDTILKKLRAKLVIE